MNYLHALNLLSFFLRLTEIGPRITLQLMKIEEGVSEGRILYHNYIEKTESEIEELEKNKLKKK